MDGFFSRALVCTCFALLNSVAHASEHQYEYRFSINYHSYYAESMEEVKAILKQLGPYYEILEVTAERKIDETTTELTLSAPPPEAVPGKMYLSYYEGSGSYDWSYTYSEAEEALARRAAELSEGPPSPRYSGTTHRGDAYTAYLYVDLPGRVTVYADGNAIPHECAHYRGGGTVANVNSWGGWIYQPEPRAWGRVCEIDDSGTRWYLGGLYANRIETWPVYFCGYGYWPEWNRDPSICSNEKVVLVRRKQLVTCPVEPIKPLQHWIDEYHKNDPEVAQLTEDLEAGANLSLRDMLTEATQQAESCVSAKFVADGFDYTLESTGRPKAYQAHFHDLYLRWLEHGRKVDEGSPEWEACAERREQVELEVGKRVGTQGKRWNAPGGQFHQINQAASAETSKHTDGRAFDVSGVDAIEDHLAQYGPPALTVEDWVNQPTDCNVGWGGLYTIPDNVHFYLREGEQQMEFINLIAALTAGIAPELPPNLHHGEPQWARLLVSGEHVDGEVVYHYTIVNQHPEAELTHVTLGIAHENGGAVPDLAEMPVGTEIMIEPHPTQPGFNQLWAETPESSWTAPPHWLLDFVKLEFFPRFYLEFWLQRASKQASVGEVQPGEQLEGFSIRLPKADPTYYETGFEASFYYPSKNYFGYPEKLDTTPPELFLSVDRPSIWPPNNKLVDINVDIDVTDDYDGQPAIKLVSITANVPLAEGDIQGAEFGTDDHSFQLRATRDGRNREGRIYTITYEATDAMANVSQKSVEVIVPHDQRR